MRIDEITQATSADAHDTSRICDWLVVPGPIDRRQNVFLSVRQVSRKRWNLSLNYSVTPIVPDGVKTSSSHESLQFTRGEGQASEFI